MASAVSSCALCGKIIRTLAGQRPARICEACLQVRVDISLHNPKPSLPRFIELASPHCQSLDRHSQHQATPLCLRSLHPSRFSNTVRERAARLSQSRSHCIIVRVFRKCHTCRTRRDSVLIAHPERTSLNYFPCFILVLNIASSLFRILDMTHHL